MKSSVGAQPSLQKKSFRGLGCSQTSFCEMQQGWILQKARYVSTRVLLAKYVLTSGNNGEWVPPCRRTATGKSNMFSGLVFCNDCKQKPYYSTTSYFEKRQGFFTFSTHRANKDKCSRHYIRAVVLEKQVWEHVEEFIWVVTCYEAYFRSEMEQRLRIQSEEKRYGYMGSGWHRLRSELGS